MLLDNSLATYLSALAILVISIGLSLIFKYILVKKLNDLMARTKNTFDDVIATQLSSVSLPFYIMVSLYIASQFLILYPTLRKLIDASFILVVVHQLITVLLIFLNYSLDRRGNGSERNTEHIKGLIQFIIRAGLWVVGLLFVLSNLGIDVTSLIAGLGISGIALALAAQTILGDLFNYFVIYFDKPFVKGDVIVTGDKMGVVEKVGIKTTRIRALQGEEIVISNSGLTSNSIQNFKKMEERRIVFSLGVTYDTPLDKLTRIPDYIREIITSTGKVRFDRAHLSSLGDSAYLFEAAYYVLSGNYNDYMDVHQSVLFQIIGIFTRENIEFAFPTHTVHLLAASHQG